MITMPAHNLVAPGELTIMRKSKASIR